MYGHRADGEPVQFVNLRLTALGQRLQQQTPGLHRIHVGKKRGAPASRGAYFEGIGVLTTSLLSREDLAGRPIKGPFIIEEYDATVVVPPGWSARLDDDGQRFD